ncbi:MAG TPA: mechanosensitive ion channel family protein [Bacillota bacterium]|nr:mechanosensitive ion channel family protein [Bacillota bacterium]
MDNEKKNRPNTSQIVKYIVLILILAVLVMLLKPELIPFISDAARQELEISVGTFLGQLPASVEQLNISVGMVISLLAMVLALYLAFVLIKLMLNKIAFKNRRRETLKRVILNLFRYLTVICGIVWGLMILGVNTAAIFAGVGILSLVISLGAQSLFSDIFTGIFIIIEDQYRVGDIISVEGFRGTVTELGIRTTKITDVGGNVKIVNNSDVRNVLNLSKQNSYAICDISIAYGADLEKAEATVRATNARLCDEYPQLFSDEPEYAGVQELADSSVVLRIIAKVNEPDIFRARRILNREHKLAFDKAGVEIPFPQVVVHNCETKK